jgi:HPt (histidine-containing phosphotransfer) domain-containing protein
MSAAPARWLGLIEVRAAQLGTDSVKRMAEIYVDEMEDLLISLAGALADGDLPAARLGAHHLGANAGSLDFLDLAAAAERLEVHCVKGERDEAMSALHDMIPIAQRSVSQLRNHFGLA